MEIRLVNMTTKNDITGDKIQSKANSEEYRNNFDLIFKKKVEDAQEIRKRPSGATAHSKSSAGSPD